VIQEYTIDIGRRLREYRRASGLTLEEMKNEIFFSEGTISNVEKGIKPLSVNMLRSMQNRTDIDIDYLITGTKTNQTKFGSLFTFNYISRNVYVKMVLAIIKTQLEKKYPYNHNIFYNINMLEMIEDLRDKEKYASMPEMMVLRCIRKSRNLRYIDVEKELGIKGKYYSAIERGVRNIKIEELILIYKIYDINPWFVITGKVENFSFVGYTHYLKQCGGVDVTKLNELFCMSDQIIKEVTI